MASSISTFQLKNLCVILILTLALLQYSESKVINCRPLPQCCRKYVFSPACRGATAKRNLPTAFQENEFIRDPRVLSMEADYGSENDYRNLESIIESLADMEKTQLNNELKDPAVEHSDYVN